MESPFLPPGLKTLYAIPDTAHLPGQQCYAAYCPVKKDRNVQRTLGAMQEVGGLDESSSDGGCTTRTLPHLSHQ